MVTSADKWPSNLDLKSVLHYGEQTSTNIKAAEISIPLLSRLSAFRKIESLCYMVICSCSLMRCSPAATISTIYQRPIVHTELGNKRDSPIHLFWPGYLSLLTLSTLSSTSPAFSSKTSSAPSNAKLAITTASVEPWANTLACTSF